MYFVDKSLLDDVQYLMNCYQNRGLSVLPPNLLEEKGVPYCPYTILQPGLVI